MQDRLGGALRGGKSAFTSALRERLTTLAKWSAGHPRWVGVAVLALNVALLGWLFASRAAFTRGGASLGGLFVVNLVSSAVPFMSAPEHVATFLAARRLPMLQVGLVAGLGASMGELPAYFIGLSGPLVLGVRAHQQLERLQESRWFPVFMRWSFATLFLVSAVPNPFLHPLILAVGMIRMPLRRYFPPVLLGKLCRFLLVAYLGSLAH